MRARRGRIEDDFKSLFLFEQTVDAFGRRRQALLPRPRQALGIRNNAGHDYRTEDTAPLELIHEIRTDVTRAQNRYRCFLHITSRSNVILSDLPETRVRFGAPMQEYFIVPPHLMAIAPQPCP